LIGAGTQVTRDSRNRTSDGDAKAIDRDMISNDMKLKWGG
jgi:hypothetical protein